MYFGARADVADFAFDKHGGIYALQGFDSLVRLADVFFKGQGGKIEDDGVKARFGYFQALGEVVGVIRIQENGKIVFFAQTAYEGGDLPSSHKLALAL